MTQFLKKFDDVLLASMKKANNNPIPNTIRINGVLLPVGSPTPTKTPTLTPTPTKTPGASLSPTPTKTPTPTITPTKTVTPTVTKTQTPTLTKTPTLTPTPTSNPIVPLCSVLYNDNNNKVYNYDVIGNSSTELNMPIQYLGGSDIAHTSNKLWEPVGTSFNEYNITLPSFTISYNRNIPYPSGYVETSGLAAISDTVILAVNGNFNPQRVVEIDVSGGSAIMTTKFLLIADRYITGDFYKTTTNKFLVLNTYTDFNTSTEICYLTQWNYLTGGFELEINLTEKGIIGCATYGIFEYDSDIYITAINTDGVSTNTYIIEKNSPYNAVYSNTINKFVSGASQVPSCLTSNLNVNNPPTNICNFYDITITQEDIDNATGNILNPSYDGVVFVSYQDCDNISRDDQYTIPGEYLNYICVSDIFQLPPNIYYFQNDIFVDGTSFSTMQGICSVAPSPTPTKTPTPTRNQIPSPTPTKTVTPTITPTKTVTPTYTPTVTPTKAPIILNADYIVFTYTFPVTSGKDLDTLTYLYVNNVTGTTYANTINPIGYCTAGSLPSGKHVGPNLWWGGDNTDTGGSESVYVDIKQLKLSGSVTSIQLNCKANWYRDTPNTGTGKVQIQMKAYSGGTMNSDGNYGFTNTGGIQVGTTYTFPDSTILTSNNVCSGTDCVGFFTYTLSTGTFVKSNTCIP